MQGERPPKSSFSVSREHADISRSGGSESQDSQSSSQDSCSGYSGNIYMKWVPLSRQESQNSPHQTVTTSVTAGDTSIHVPEPLFSMSPGSFDVVLCVDNQEHYGGV